MKYPDLLTYFYLLLYICAERNSSFKVGLSILCVLYGSFMSHFALEQMKAVSKVN